MEDPRCLRSRDLGGQPKCTAPGGPGASTLISAPIPRWPNRSSKTALATRGASTAASTATPSVLPQLLQMMDVQAVELLADLEHEHTQDQKAHQHVKRDA